MRHVTSSIPRRGWLSQSRLGLLVAVLLAVVAAVAVTPPAQAAGSKGPNPNTTIPWQQPQYWPFNVGSSHFVVHYQESGDVAKATEVSGYLEEAWTAYITNMGFPEPLSDNGVAGPDGRLDAYLWRNTTEFYVDEVAPNLNTSYDDRSVYIALDPWGRYGSTSAELRANLYHEFRHAIQAVDDWWEHIQAFESDATLFEARAYGYSRLADVWADYQAHPDWGLFRDDGYVTWYMYGGALFHEFLSVRQFGGGLEFLGTMWTNLRNPPGAEQNPALNEPDFVDALQGMLVAKSSSFYAEAIQFARDRWYSGPRANGILPHGDDVPAVASLTHSRGKGAKTTKQNVDPMVTGTQYVVVRRASTDPATLTVTRSGGSSSVRHIVQVVGEENPANDRTVTLPASIGFGSDGQFVLAVTVLPPANVLYDPDTQTDTRYRLTLSFAK